MLLKTVTRTQGNNQALKDGAVKPRTFEFDFVEVEPLIHARRVDSIGPADLPRTDNYYGWAKIAYEALGFMYASGAFGRQLGVVQVRIGAPREIEAANFADKSPSVYKRDLGAYISARDLSQLIVKSIETEQIEDAHGIPWQIFYGISNNTRAFWSNVNARRVIGYAPEDDSEVKFATDIQRLLQERADNLASPDAWVRGCNYDQNKLAERRHPDRHDLDAIAGG